MKALFFAVCLILTPQAAFADYCSEVGAGVPCTPDPGTATTDAKKEIVRLIGLALKADEVVTALEQSYRDVRGKVAPERELEALELYRTAKREQDALFKKAMNKTGELYQVGPSRKQVTIAKPADPAMNYVTNLIADWDPQVTESGPNVSLVLKIKGSDNLDHYIGADMDPSVPGGKFAETFPDGRIVVLKHAFVIAQKNPGFLASLLYHESRHFNQLRRGWASLEEDEKAAYKAGLATADLFGLTPKQKEGLQASFDTFDMEVHHARLTYPHPTPAQEVVLGAHYETVQINLEEAYTKLKATVEEARRKSLTSESDGFYGAIKGNNGGARVAAQIQIDDTAAFLRRLEALVTRAEAVRRREAQDERDMREWLQQADAFRYLASIAGMACENPDGLAAEVRRGMYAGVSMDRFHLATYLTQIRAGQGITPCQEELLRGILNAQRGVSGAELLGWARLYRNNHPNMLQRAGRALSEFFEAGREAGGSGSSSSSSTRSGPSSEPRRGVELNESAGSSEHRPAVKHDPDGVAKRQLEKMEDDARRKRWGLEPR